jgi:hypothetical protein
VNPRRSLVVLALLVVAALPRAAGAACAIPQAVGSQNGATVFEVPVGTLGENCMDASVEYLERTNMGNGQGTRSFELIGTVNQQLADSAVSIVDGTTMRMRGLPRITGNRFTFTNDQGRLVQLPLREVKSTDSGQRFRCSQCRRDAEGRVVPDPAVQLAFAATNPCPAAAEGGCAGYVIDHATPLACGGDDVPGNLQWLSAADAQRKAAWVARGCKTAG